MVRRLSPENRTELERRRGALELRLELRRNCVLSRRLRSRLPLACELLPLGYLRWGHEPCKFVSSFYAILVALRRRQAEPHVGKNVILRENAQVELGWGVALLSGRQEPFSRLRRVLRHALSPEVHGAEIEARSCIALIGKRLHQLQSGLVVTSPVSRDSVLERPCAHRVSKAQRQNDCDEGVLERERHGHLPFVPEHIPSGST